MKHLYMNTFFVKSAIPFFVFITGACVLVVEVVAVRILSPYYGNTIFTFSSVISVVLLALSIGYYVGGKLADKYPKESLFFHIIAASGAAVMILYLVGLFFLPNAGYQLSVTKGPIISSIVLFFAQSFLLGTLSPFAIKLQQLRLPNLQTGNASGQIFFWSTLGSIAGSLGAGFYLIPNFGVDKIMVGVGFLLIILGLFGNLKLHLVAKTFVILFLLISTIMLAGTLDANGNGAIYSRDGLYQKITIYDGIYNGREARFLFQDKNASAAKYLESDELAYEYTKYYSLYEIFSPNPKEVLAIGGGAYSVPRTLLDELPDVNIDAVEIEPSLYLLAQQYFGLKENQRLKNHIGDGRRFLHDSPKKYDVIFSDAYASFYSTPEHLTTQEFFTLAKEKMNPGGVFIANVIGSIVDKTPSFALSEIKTFQSVFENSYFFAVTSLTAPKTQNLIFVGYHSDQKINIASGNSLLASSKNEIIKNLPSKIIDTNKFNFSKHNLLTDNFAPVDYLISREFTNFR